MLSKNNITQIEKALHYTFKDKNLLNQAFTHSSYGNINTNQNNERLEFLGDSVLHFITTEYLYKKFNLSEGDLSKLRAYVVSKKHLSKCLSALGVSSLLQYEKGKTSKVSEAMEANLFEAILGAIYLDAGIEKAKNFVIKVLKYSKELFNSLTEHPKDYKTQLQEVVQLKKDNHLEYKLVKRQGPAHNPIFTTEVLLNNKVFGRASAKSKKEAQNLAAKEALRELSKNNL